MKPAQYGTSAGSCETCSIDVYKYSGGLEGDKQSDLNKNTKKEISTLRNNQIQLEPISKDEGLPIRSFSDGFARWKNLQRNKGGVQQTQGGSWDLNGDGKLQKSEADKQWLSNGGDVWVDNSKIDWTGLQIPNGLKKDDIFSISTHDAFLKLPFETAATYGGTSFKVINDSQVEVIDQKYHYDFRPNNSAENILRNFLTLFGYPIGIDVKNYNILIYYSGSDYKIHYYNRTINIK
jgi:hypothetical protein